MADESDEHVESSQSDSLIANKQDDGDHSHDGCGHSHTYNESQKKPLLYALLLTFVFVVAQIIAAAMANSLSLLADALHHLVDCIIVVTALLAVELTQRGDANTTVTFTLICLASYMLFVTIASMDIEKKSGPA